MGEASTSYRVRLDTTKGPVILEVHPDWAPLGAGRFRELVDGGFFSDLAFFRVLDGFVAQFGISGDPAVASEWRSKNLKDDPVRSSNTRGTVSFAMAGANTRTTQLFINYGDNSQLDTMGFSPFAVVVDGMENVDALYGGYGEGSPRGKGPDQGRVQKEGNTYLKGEFPKLDYVVSATVV
ncbi:MAG TPA: peptidylprolyl isomerase [Spirochaetia bacterium]|nr:peptidylprolyl isomerase [Spirochaetia bacterium]